MTGFDAGSIEELAYLIPASMGGDGVRHVIPEPTTTLVADFWNSLEEWTREALDAAQIERRPDEPEADWQARRQQFLEGARDRWDSNNERRVALYSAVCGGSPSVEELRGWPDRVRRAFERYIIEALSPEAPTAATNT